MFPAYQLFSVGVSLLTPEGTDSAPQMTEIYRFPTVSAPLLQRTNLRIIAYIIGP